MVFPTARNFTTLIQAMGLIQGSYKPSPTVSDHPHLRTVDKTLVRPPHNGTHDDPQTQAPAGGDYQQAHPANLSFVQTDIRVLDTTFDPCAVQPYDSPDLGPQTFAPFDQTKATVYRYRQQQSVNLGSWFVHEPWMTPSVFACAAEPKSSEIDIASGWGSTNSARAVLEHHWDTFITASDFQYLANIGINTVRLPIGYWSLGPDYCQGTPFEPVSSVYQNSWPRVIRAINMAAAQGIGVLVDLHGAPGSQNGQQHSGISDNQVNLFGNDWFVNKTLTVLTFLIQELVNVTNVVGVQILNEPQNVDSLADFYSTAISTMRQVSKAAESFPLYLHDGFDLDRFSNFVGNRTDFVVQDHHSYFVFTPEDQNEPASNHTSDVHSSISESLAKASIQQRRNLVVDEFSCALTDQSLAGEGDADQARKDFCVGQMDIYQNETAGWSFWAYNKEGCDDDPGWCFKAAVGRSLSPTFFTYKKGPFADPTRIPALADMLAEMGGPSPSDVMQSPEPSSPMPSSNPTYKVGMFATKSGFKRRIQQRSESMSAPSASADGAHETNWEQMSVEKREAASQLPLDPSQRAISKGYSDGYLTAKIFALYGMSKLGFTGQYIYESIVLLGNRVIEPGTEHYYERWFMEGLNDGEDLITSYVDQM